MKQRSKVILTMLSGLVLFLVGINILLAVGNRSIQTEVGERQQLIAHAIQLDTLNRQVVSVLANMAMKTNDEQLKKLLASSGVDLTPSPQTAGSAK